MNFVQLSTGVLINLQHVRALFPPRVWAEMIEFDSSLDDASDYDDNDQRIGGAIAAVQFSDGGYLKLALHADYDAVRIGIERLIGLQ